MRLQRLTLIWQRNGVCSVWVCESCGAWFTEPKLVPFYREKFPGCPECNSLLIYDDASQCSVCEGWYKDDDMFLVAGICKDCVEDILCERHDLLVDYAREDIDAFAEFVSEKLKEEKRIIEKAPMCCCT